ERSGIPSRGASGGSGGCAAALPCSKIENLELDREEVGAPSHLRVDAPVSGLDVDVVSLVEVREPALDAVLAPARVGRAEALALYLHPRHHLRLGEEVSPFDEVVVLLGQIEERPAAV